MIPDLQSGGLVEHWTLTGVVSGMDLGYIVTIVSFDIGSTTCIWP